MYILFSKYFFGSPLWQSASSVNKHPIYVLLKFYFLCNTVTEYTFVYEVLFCTLRTTDTIRLPKPKYGIQTSKLVIEKQTTQPLGFWCKFCLTFVPTTKYLDMWILSFSVSVYLPECPKLNYHWEWGNTGKLF